MGIFTAHPNSQTYISRTITEKTFWPAAWCVSFKHALIPRWPMNLFRSAPLPSDTRVVCFTGKPDPDEARDGRWPAPWYKKVYKIVRPTPWIAEHWRPDPLTRRDLAGVTACGPLATTTLTPTQTTPSTREHGSRRARRATRSPSSAPSVLCLCG